ncbi:manganese transporter [Haloferula helveola]|uniref:Manganese transporter n=1 Tax=Haloferula helveola TaxID=490095 RepID=A0ABM7RIU5_9BACT|nr:manganese transporter [Haloferula helveola]
MRPLRFILSALAALGLVGCGEDQNSTSDGTPKVVTTIAMIGDVAREIGGEHVSVESLIGEGVDPHLYKPSSPDLKKLQAADLIFYNGLMLEGKMTDTMVRFARSGKPVHAVTETILGDSNYVMSDEADHFDPHVWMDVSGWIKAAGEIELALSELAPQHAADFKTNHDHYVAELGKLDEYARTSLGSIPEGQRVLITAHDAFGYMARAYGLEVRGIQGISTESEAGLKDINDLVNFIIERKIPAVFVESSIPRKSVEALVEGTRSRGHDVSIGGELFSDAMGTTGTYEGTYIGMIDHNVTTITRALGGTAPEKGMNGKLN